jgi:alpha-L-glutamate ligase-like protein
MYKNRKLVLGMNERNLSFIRRGNSPKAKEIADNKLKTKLVLTAAGIPTPKLIGQVNSYTELQEFNWEALPNSFVIKPVSGLEGGGIEIFYNRDKQGNWIKADGSRYSLSQIQALAADIVDGKYSLHNQPDSVFFEERVKMHKAFQYYAFKGVPDVRIIVFNSMPIMSYIRIPTRESDGKANLALGAIGSGIDIATGVTTTAIIGKEQEIEYIPHSKLSVSGLKIPYWNKILQYAVTAQRATGLGFAGIDFLIDREKGPMVVEMNARPGLSIQLANQDGLRWRLRKARGVKVQSIEKGTRLGKDLFGGGIEEDIERISGKTLIGIYEDVTIFPVEDSVETEDSSSPKTNKIQKLKSVTTKAKIDTGADSTSLDATIAMQLGYGPYIEKYNEICKMLEVPDDFQTMEEAQGYVAKVNEELSSQGLEGFYCESIRSSHGRSLRLYIPVKLDLGDLKYETKANLYDRSQMTYKMIVGRKSLNRFLVEPSRKKPE